MYIYCVYPAIPKSPKQQLDYPKMAETSVVLIVFKVSSVTSMLILLPFCSIALYESGTRKSFINSMTKS